MRKNLLLVLPAIVCAIVFQQSQNAFAQTHPQARAQGESLPSRNVGNDPRFPPGISSPGRTTTGNRVLPSKERSKDAFKKAEGFLNAEKPNYERAAYWLEITVRGDPNFKKAYLLLGSAYVHLELFKSAAFAYQEALSLHGKSFDAMIGLGKSNFYLRDFDAAIGFYQKALVMNPTDYTVNVMLANNYFMQKRFEQAAASYQKTLEINSQSIEAHYNLALCYFNLNNREAAVKQNELLGTINKQASEQLKSILGN